MLNGATNAVLYQSTSSSAACNYLLGPSGVATSGNTIYVESGAYTLDATWNIAVSGVTVTFQSGAGLTATSNYNAGGFGIDLTGNNIIITGLTLDGNGLNMYPSPTTKIDTNTYNQMWTGINIAGNNCLIQYSTIHNWRADGVEVLGSNNGVMNSTIYDCAANSITLVGTNNYAINNNVYHASDVGISAVYSTDNVVTGNYVHDCTPTLSPMYGFQNSYWGIGGEGSGGGSGNGNYYFIAGNTITNIQNYGVFVDSRVANVLISGNTINNSHWVAIAVQSSNNIIEFNTINDAAYGIVVEGSTNEYGDSFSNISSQNFYPSGVSASNNPTSVVAITVTSSATGVGFVTANGSAGYAGSYSTSPYIFYATVGNTITLAANTVLGYTFNGWSDSGAQTHTITVPSSDATYTAAFT